MSAQAQMRALLDQLMGTARDGELPQNASQLVSQDGATAEAGLWCDEQICMNGCNVTAEGCVKDSNVRVK